MNKQTVFHEGTDLCDLGTSIASGRTRVGAGKSWALFQVVSGIVAAISEGRIDTTPCTRCKKACVFKKDAINKQKL